MDFMLTTAGNSLAKYLSRPGKDYNRYSLISESKLEETLRPCDLILVEGNSRISTAIKYLTQSTWSHVAIFIGRDVEFEGKALKPLVEADLINGVQDVPLNQYQHFNVRICRPINLQPQDQEAIVNFICERIGYRYDTKNIFDLMRYLLPTPPVPARFRRNLIAFGSGDPTKAICSTLIAQAFQSVRYPILPRTDNELCGQLSTMSDDLVLQQRHYSHFTPRDFDLSPFFDIVKPTARSTFDYQNIKWTK